MIKLFPFNALTQTFPFFYFKEIFFSFYKNIRIRKAESGYESQKLLRFLFPSVHERKLASTGGYSIPFGAWSVVDLNIPSKSWKVFYVVFPPYT